MNFIDITLCLENSSYCRYLKDKNEIIYVNTECNHPRSIVTFIGKRRNIQEFNPYQEVLTKAEYKQEMLYQQNIRQNTTNHPKSEKEYNIVQSIIQCKTLLLKKLGSTSCLY